MDGKGELIGVYPRRTQQAGYQGRRRAAHPACHLEALSGCSERLKPMTDLGWRWAQGDLQNRYCSKYGRSPTCRSGPALDAKMHASQFQEQMCSIPALSLRGEKAELLLRLFTGGNRGSPLRSLDWQCLAHLPCFTGFPQGEAGWRGLSERGMEAQMAVVTSPSVGRG